MSAPSLPDLRLATLLLPIVCGNDVKALDAAYTARAFDVNAKLLLTSGRGVYKVPERRGSATLLHLAAVCGCGDVVKWLLAHGADVTLPDGHGNTALDVVKDGPTRLLLSRAALKAVDDVPVHLALTAVAPTPPALTIPSPWSPQRSDSIAGRPEAVESSVTNKDLLGLGTGPLLVAPPPALATHACPLVAVGLFCLCMCVFMRALACVVCACVRCV